MVFSEEDKVLIKNLYLLKGYGARRLMTEFPIKNWNRGALNLLLLKLRKTGSTNRQKGSGQSVIDDAIDEWRKRLRACVRARGGHFEHLL